MHKDGSDFKVGDLVQFVNEDHSCRDGQVVSITPPKREKPQDYWRYSDTEQADMFALVKVKWADGEESEISDNDLSTQDSALERQFRNEALLITDQIDEKLSLAMKALDEAEKLSEKHGVPFSSGISPLSQNYWPASFSDKWEDVDDDIVSEITSAYQGEYGDGWEHSAVC